MKKYSVFVNILLISCFCSALSAQEMSLDDAWNRVKTYRYGDDLQSLLLIERAVEASTVSAEEKAKTAVCLAALLTDETPYPGRQFICMQLRLIGGAAEVPKLAEYLFKPQDSENARLALEDIRCEESLVPLRKALETFEGRPLAGVIASLAARNDRESLSKIASYLDSDDETVAAASAGALGRFGADGIALLRAKIASPCSVVIGNALMEAADGQATQGDKNGAKVIFDLLSSPEQSKGIRRAALEGTLRLQDDAGRKSLVLQWFFEDDSDKNIIAAAHLKELSGEQFDELFQKIHSVGPQGRVVLLEIISQRDAREQLPVLLRSVESSDRTERIAALRTLGKINDASTIPVLLKSLAAEDADTQNAAGEALLRFDAGIVGPQLVASLADAKIRNRAIDLIVSMKYYDAINPMLDLAKQEDAAVYEPIVDGLGRLCDPDEHDLPRLLELYLSSRPGRHRDRVERCVVVVCEKLPDADARASILLDLLAKRNEGLSNAVLTTAFPLLGKVGNKRVAELLFPLLESKQPELKQSALRALCNWPNADYLTELWETAIKNPNGQFRQWALRAYIRVATLKSDRPESETLEMLKQAMRIARTDADKRFCLSRTSAIRTMESAEWAASYLDDPVLSQTACLAIVELAHHRFLREPNKAKFEPILLKVELTAKDKDVAQRAQKSRLGM